MRDAREPKPSIAQDGDQLGRRPFRVAAANRGQYRRRNVRSPQGIRSNGCRNLRDRLRRRLQPQRAAVSVDLLNFGVAPMYP